MQNLSIRSKLYLITALISIVLFALGGLSIYSLRVVNDKSTEISSLWIPRIKMSDEINTLASDYRSMQYNYLVAATPQDKAAAESEMERMLSRLDDMFQAYEAIAREERKAAIREARADWDAYAAHTRQLLFTLPAAEAGVIIRTTAKAQYDEVTTKIVEAGKAAVEGANESSAEGDDIYAFVSQVLIGVVAVSIIVALCALLFVSKRISGGIAEVLDAAKKIADGDLKNTVRVASQDEIGQLGEAVNQMTVNLRGLIGQIQKTSGQVAASSEELTASAEQSAQVTETIAQSVTTVAEMSGRQITTVNAASSTVERMSADIEQTAATVGETAERTKNAVESAEQGNQAIETAVNQMNNIETTVNQSAEVIGKLGERSKEIGSIVDTISGIAGQTNLLALNAAIEAARAGEQGKGFAVVAEEVRKLAEQSQDAAKQIGALITEIQEDTNEAVSAMQNGTSEVKIGASVVATAGQSFATILDMVGEVNGQANAIAATMKNLAGGARQIVGAVHDVDDAGKQVASEAQSVSAATQQQSASMEEIAAASRNLASLAEQLEQASAKFRL